MADQRDKYFIDLTVEQGQGLTKMEAMVKAMERLKEERRKLNVEFKNGKRTEAEYVKNIDRIQVGLKGLSGRYREASNAASGLTREGIRFRDKMAGAMTSSLAKLGGAFAATFAVGRVTKFFGDAISKVENFEAAVSVLGAISKATDKDLEKLTKRARELAAASKYTATQVVEAQTELAKLGQTPDQIYETTEAILLLATAAGSDITSAATYATTTMNQFQLSASDTGRIVDVMAESFNRSALDLESWNNAFKQVGTTANAVDMSLEDTAAAISILVDAGIPAEKAGTDLRNILIELADSGMTWDEAMNEIRTDTNQLSKSTDLFKRRAGAAGIVLAENAEKLDKLKDGYKNAAGAADELAKAQLNNLRGDKLILASAWEEFILSVEDGTGVVSNFARSLTQGLTNGVNALAMLGNESKTAAYNIEVLEKSLAGAKKMLEYNDSDRTRERIKQYEIQLKAEKNRLAMITKYGAEGAKAQSKIVELLREQKELEEQRVSDLARYGTTTVNPRLVAIEKEIDRLEKTLNIEEEITRKKKDQLAANASNEEATKNVNNELDKSVTKTTELEKETKNVEENIGGWADSAKDYIDLIDGQTKRNTIDFGISDQEGDDISQDAVDEAMAAGLDAFKAGEEEKTRIAQDELTKRNELIKEQTLSSATQVASLVISNAQQTADRRFAVEFDLLEKMRQAGEISQEEYERLTTEARRRQFEETKKLRLAEAVINGAAAVISALTSGPSGLVQAGIVAGQTALQIGLISAQQFAKGGVVQNLSDGRISGSGNIPTQPNGDNMLATVKTGEVILNQRQQRALGGASTFRQIGVPGFAAGGVADGLNNSFNLSEKRGIAAPGVSASLGVRSGGIDYTQMATAFSNVNIETSIVEIMSNLSNQNKISELKRL
jgi:hypothetical protein